MTNESQSQPRAFAQNDVPPHIAFVGYSNSGKTRLAARLVTLFKSRGRRIGVLKHDGHDFQLDIEGKDTHQYGEAGADIVMIASATKLNVLERFPPGADATHNVEQLLQRFTAVDFVIIEGYKHEAAIPKILLVRTEEQLELLEQLSGLVAVVAVPEVRSLAARRLINRSVTDAELPLFDPDEVEALSHFIERKLQLEG